ncbi:LRC14 protein, partial [Cercotrichas coryphoeus]|nr:LRC14 protein [Cercotrichas coryphoeus]
MDSLLFLCARRVVDHRPLPALPAHLYPVLFQVAFLDGRARVVRDLVTTWPFPVLNFQRLLGHRELLWDFPCMLCIKAVIKGVVVLLRQELEEPGGHSRWVYSLFSSLRMLDMTGLSDSVSGDTAAGSTVPFISEALAKACVEVSKLQQEFQRHGSKWPKDCSGDSTSATALEPLGVDVHTDLFVKRTSYGILCHALQTGATGPLRLKCRELQAAAISASEIVTLLESLHPSRLRRVDLVLNNLGLAGLSVILPHFSRFPELRSLKFRYSKVDVRHLTPESAVTIRCVAQQLGMLPSLRELNMGCNWLSGNLHQILCDFQAPLESLELPSCSLLPTDLTFLSQRFHPAALRKLDLSGHNISQGLLEPLRLLLEETSASLLQLDLTSCHMADSHLAVLLPTLLRCSHLRFLRLHGNPLSTAAIKDVLQKTLELPDLHLVVYPVPEDCYKLELWYSNLIAVEDEKLLAVTTAEISQLLENSGRTDVIWTSSIFGHRDLDYFSL